MTQFKTNQLKARKEYRISELKESFYFLATLIALFTIFIYI